MTPVIVLDEDGTATVDSLEEIKQVLADTEELVTFSVRVLHILQLD